MKKILKRGTSLLLVVAMLLSFAVTVGAEPATTESGTANDGLVTLWADVVPVKAGERVYVPLYAKVSPQNGIGMLEFDLYCDSGLTLKNVLNKNKNTGTTLGGTLEAYGYGSEGRWRVVWTDSVPLGWTVDDEEPSNPPIPPTTDNVLIGWAIVEATETSVGGKQIHFGPLEGNENNAPYRFIYKGGVDISKNPDDHPFEDVTLEDGAAIVYNELPMVALTKTTFDVPKMEDVQTNPGASNYKVADYLKIVADVNGEAKLFDVDADSLTWSTSLKKVNTTATHLSFRTETEDGPATLTVSNVTSTDKSASINGEKTLSFTVNKATPVATYVGFGTSFGYVAPTNFAGPYSVPS